MDRYGMIWIDMDSCGYSWCMLMFDWRMYVRLGLLDGSLIHEFLMDDLCLGVFAS